MKKIFSTLAAIALSVTLFAQSSQDAIKFSQNFYEGSARTVAMGNAFTALGGDLGSLAINPAASGIYRYSEVFIAPSLSFNNSSVNYLSTKKDDNITRFGLSGLGVVFATNPKYHKKGDATFNFAFAINKVNDFSHRMSVSGETDKSSWLSSLANNISGIHAKSMDITNTYDPFRRSSAPWRAILAWNSNLLDTLPDSGRDYKAATENLSGLNIVIGGPLRQNFVRESTGNVSEAIINMGGKISDNLFIGFNLGLQSLSYDDYQQYSEKAVNPANFTSKFSEFKHTYRQKTTGVGINIKAGIIALPADGLRIGASVSTPTWYAMNDEWDETIFAAYSDGYTIPISSPIGEYNYNLSTPLRLNAGIAYTFGSYGLISADYEFVDYSMSRLRSNGDKTAFNFENDQIKNNYKAVNNARLGIEIKPMQGFAVRGGYSYYQNPDKNAGSDLHYVSAGLGFIGKSGVFADFALQRRLSTEDFKLYSDAGSQRAPIGTLDDSRIKLMFTIGFRF